MTCGTSRSSRRSSTGRTRLLIETIWSPSTRPSVSRPRRPLLASPIRGEAIRVTYWLAPDRRIVLLTVFRKTRMRETAEVERAKQARKVCETEHDAAQHEYSRIVRIGEKP